MATFSIESADVAPVEVLEQFTRPAGEQLYAGYWGYESSDGKVYIANAYGYGERHGMILGSVVLNQAVTILENGVVAVGDAFASLDVGTPIKLGWADGVFEDTAGTGPEIGTVTATWGTGETTNLLKIDKTEA